MKLKTVFVIILCSFLISCESKTNKRSFFAMNTHITIKSTCGKNKSANREIEQKFYNLEKLISTTAPVSEVYLINNNSGTVKLSDETFFLAKYALDGAVKTNGKFNPALYPVIRAWGFTTEDYKIPSDIEISQLLELTDFSKIKLDSETKTITMPEKMMLDFGAIGKGFAGDEAIRILKENNVPSAILDLGGNIQVLGKNLETGEPWKVGIRNPYEDGVAVSLKVTDCAVITSGGYERFFVGKDGKKYIHIFDGETGRPVENNVVSSTIVCEKGIYGDFLSTTLFVMGKEKAIEFWKENRDFEFIMMFDDLILCYTAGLKDKIDFLTDFNKIEIIQ